MVIKATGGEAGQSTAALSLQGWWSGQSGPVTTPGRDCLAPTSAPHRDGFPWAGEQARLGPRALSLSGLGEIWPQHSQVLKHHDTNPLRDITKWCQLFPWLRWPAWGPGICIFSGS